MEFIEIKGKELCDYDKFIRNSPNGDLLQSPMWTHVKEDWDSYFFAIKDKGEIIAAITAMVRPMPYIRKKIMYLPRGPIFYNYTSFDLWALFTKEIKKIAKAMGCVFVKIDPAIKENNEINHVLKDLGYSRVIKKGGFGGIQPKSTFRLDINLPHHELLANMPKKTRYNINYPEKKGVMFKELGKESITEFERVMDATSSRANFLSRHVQYYYKLLEAVGDDASLILAYYDDVPVAGGITLAYGDKAWAMYGGAANIHTNFKTYYGLNYRRMLWAQKKGAKYFDFFGIPVKRNKGDKLYGLYQFKKAFGGTEVNFIGEHDLVVDSLYYQIWNIAQYGLGIMRKMKKQKSNLLTLG